MKREAIPLASPVFQAWATSVKAALTPSSSPAGGRALAFMAGAGVADWSGAEAADCAEGADPGAPGVAAWSWAINGAASNSDIPNAAKDIFIGFSP